MSAGQLLFVNVHGAPLHVESLIAQQPKKPGRDKSDSTPRHLGFAVTGFSPEQIREAEKSHMAKLALDPDVGAWSPEEWMNGARPKKAAPKNFAVPTAAELCANMVRKAGWQRVSVEEIIR